MRRTVAPVCSIVLTLVASLGCSGLNDDDVLESADGGLQGAWTYAVDNGYEATFTDCTDDAEVLEGLSLVDGMGVAPICIVATGFDLVQNGDAFSVTSRNVACSDGNTAPIVGDGLLFEGTVSGAWRLESTSGVRATHVFSGSMIAGGMALTETERSFEGAFEGTCRFSPSLSATAIRE